MVLRIVAPLALPGAVAAFILSSIPCWNERLLTAPPTCADARTLPVTVASRTGWRGLDGWWMATSPTTAGAPLVVIGIIKGPSSGAVTRPARDEG